jgi:hypothetical protein
MNDLTPHPSHYELECMSVQVLAPERVRALADHMAACAQCAAYLQELQAEQRALQQRLPAREFVRRITTTSNARSNEQQAEPGWPLLAALRAWLTPATLRVSLAIGCAAVLAIAAVVAWYPRSGPEQLRAMGSLQVTAYLQHHDRVTPVEHHAIAAPGDAVRFALALPQRGYVAIFFMDEQGALSWFVPAAPAIDALAAGPGETTIPGSARFDEGNTSMRVFVVYRTEQFSPTARAGELHDAWKRAGSPPLSEGAWLRAYGDLWSVYFARP